MLYHLKRAFWQNAWQHCRIWLRSDRVRLWLINHEPRRYPTYTDAAERCETWQDVADRHRRG